MIFITKYTLVYRKPFYLSIYLFLLAKYSQLSHFVSWYEIAFIMKKKESALMNSPVDFIINCDFLIYSYHILFCWRTCQVKNNKALHYVLIIYEYKLSKWVLPLSSQLKKKWGWHQIYTEKIELPNDTICAPRRSQTFEI